MQESQIIAQLAVAISVIYVWVFRFHNIKKEFNQFKLSDPVRNLVGAIKIALATLLITAIWYTSLVFIPAVLMGLMMVSAQFFHLKAKNPFIQRLPSLILLLLCVFIAALSYQ